MYRYLVKPYDGIANAIYMNSPYRLAEHGLSISNEVELKDEIIYSPAMGVARSKGTMRNESLITSLKCLDITK